MVSKGTMSMEELRGQLAERLPGALQAAADGAGITTAQLIKMVESGSVLAEDLLPGMAAQLQKLYGNKDVEGFTAGWNKLTNAVSESIGRIGQTQAVMTAVGGTLAAVKEVVLVLGTGVITVAEGFRAAGQNGWCHSSSHRIGQLVRPARRNRQDGPRVGSQHKCAGQQDGDREGRSVRVWAGGG